MRNPHELFHDYARNGVTQALTHEEAQTLARLLIGEEAYQDAKHPNHDIVVQDVAQLYEMTTADVGDD